MHLPGWLRAAAIYASVAIICWGAFRLFEPVRVAGRSMKPALFPGDLVLVARGAGWTTGDIVLLNRQGHGPVLHRVVGRLADGTVETKGDANEFADITPARTPEVAGRVIAVVPVGAVLHEWRVR